MEGAKNPLYKGHMESRVYLSDPNYFYLPHYKYEGIYELYWVDNGTEHCIQNFCLESSAETLAREDRFWRQNGSKLTNQLIPTKEIQRLKEREEYRLRFEGEGDLGGEEDFIHPLQKQKEEEEEQQRKRDARKKRREARKAKEKKK